MLDAFTLRVAFGVVAICVLVVTYVVTYRGTRSSYSGWWCLALLAFGPGALLFLLNDTPWQVVANPLGNAVSVLGAVFVVAACRSLSGRRLPVRSMVALPLLVWLSSLLDDPGNDVWPAGTIFLAAMCGAFAVACVELFHLLATMRESALHRTEYRASVAAMCAVSGFLAVFYAGRTLTFVAVGPEHELFATYFGTSAVTLVLLVMLVVASSSLTTLSYGDQTMALRERAARDPLTGVLNRDGLATVLKDHGKRQPTGVPVAVIMADLDRFKGLNDEHGHGAGDEALVAFARAARESVAANGVVARLGGDEFLLALRGVDPEEVVAAIDRRYLDADRADRRPTVSYGIVDLRPGEDVMEAASRADRALYRAKASGRGRSVRHRD